MARVEWSEEASLNLDRLIQTHSLPNDTRRRVKHSLEQLTRFPRLGPVIAQRGEYELRFVLGPWPWLVIVYTYLDGEDRVVIVAAEDGRSAEGTTARR